MDLLKAAFVHSTELQKIRISYKSGAYYQIEKAHTFKCMGYQFLDMIAVGHLHTQVSGAPPPTGPNSFVFTYVFTEKRLCWRLAPLQ